MATIRGDTSLIQTQTQLKSEPGNNGATVYTFTGTEIDARNKGAQMLALGYSVELQPDGPFWTVNCSIQRNVEQNPVETEPPSKWNLIDVAVEENLLETDREPIQMLTTQTKALIEYKLKNPTSTTAIIEKSKASNTAYFTAANAVYTLMACGVKSRVIFTKTLKRTITVNSGYATTWTQAFKGKILSTNRLVTAFGVPWAYAQLLTPSSYVVFNPQDAVQYQLQTFYGWLDNGVQIQDASNNQIQISQEWLWNKYPLLSYDIVE